MKKSYIVALLFWKQSKVPLQKDNELIRHLGELMKVAVAVDIAVSCSNRVIHE